MLVQSFEGSNFANASESEDLGRGEVNEAGVTIYAERI